MQQQRGDFFEGLVPDLDDGIGGESHEIQISLDDGTQIVDYKIKLIVGSHEAIIKIDTFDSDY